MTKVKVSILFIFFVSFALFSQSISNWKNYTNMKNVRAVVTSPQGIWAATDGGGFFYNAGSDNYLLLNKTDGLNGSSLTAVTVDKEGKIWFGSEDGTINVYNPANNSIKSILDIFNYNNVSAKAINELKASGDTVIASTDFGVSLININDLSFYDTYLKFGGLSSYSVVNSTLKNSLIYVCTNFGIAVQKKDAVNLSAPESWNIYNSSSGLPSEIVNKVISYKGDLIAATNKGLVKFDGNSWVTYIPQLNGKIISNLLAVGDSLYVISNNNINVYTGDNLSTVFSGSVAIYSIAYSTSFGLLAATSKGILKIKNSTEGNYFAPNGPETNQFPSMVVDNAGTLWCASGTDVTGKGFYKMSKGTWENYNMQTTPELNSNAYHVVYTAPDDAVYFGGWGHGFIRITDGILTTFNTQNTGMFGIQDDPNYLVITGFATDSKNNLWVLNYGAADRKHLAMLTPDSLWYHFSIPVASNYYIQQNFNLLIDDYDTKWFCSLDPAKSGLFYFNENKTLNDQNDDISGFLNSASGLNSNIITSIVKDRRGDIWVGTNLGVNVISNTSSILSSTNPQIRISPSVFTLRQQSINCLAVDPLNQKWVGTNQGLLLVNSDGSALLATFDSKNSPLLADEIRSIAIDDKTGTVYVGTDAGLTSFQTMAITPQESFTSLFTYPSPFIISDGNNMLTISGLIRDTDLKIISISGKLIKEFSSPGGLVAAWNGKDTNGNFVNSGIYIVVAYDKDGNNVAAGKIAVLRK